MFENIEKSENIKIAESIKIIKKRRKSEENSNCGIIIAICAISKSIWQIWIVNPKI